MSLRSLIPISVLISSALFFFSHTAEAKVFRNSYISFELPNNWRCNMEGTEWTCFSNLNKKTKEAVIIFTAKEAGPADTLTVYTEQLKKVRTIPGANKRPVKSKVQYVKRYNLNGKTWVDSLHLNSEVEAYYTRYVATVESGLGILITFSAHRAYYAAYSDAFRKAIASLKVVASKGLLSGRSLPRGGNNTGPAPIGQNTIGVLPESDSGFNVRSKGSGKTSTKRKIAYLLILFSVLGAAYYLLKPKK